MKQIIRFSFMLLALLLPALATAHDFDVDGIYYNINGNEATVTYGGQDCYSFDNEYSGTVVIPATVTYNETTYPVTSIGTLAFYDCTELTSVVIPNSVTEIGQQAFARCPGLTSFVVDSSNPRYDSRDNCNAIIETASNTLIVGCKNTTIHNSVTAIGPYAFDGSTGLTSIVIPNSVTEIAPYAFENCTGLNSIVIPNSLTEIGHRAFGECPELLNVYCYIADLSRVSSGWNQFALDNDDYSPRTLHVLQGMADDYRADANWYPYFAQIVDDLRHPLPVDPNGDWEVNIADINAVIDMILNGSDNPCGDVNSDGEITIADVNTIIELILYDN